MIVAKGVGPALPAIFGGTIFSIVLVLYWMQTQRGDASGDAHGVDWFIRRHRRPPNLSDRRSRNPDE
jgi:hypothetical protein